MRDPRLDPQPGDVIRHGLYTRRVTERGEESVVYVQTHGLHEAASSWIDVSDMNDWREWADGSTVVVST